MSEALPAPTQPPVHQTLFLAGRVGDQAEYHRRSPDPFSQNGTFRYENGVGSKLETSTSTTYENENGTVVPFSAHENAIIRNHSRPFVVPDRTAQEHVRTVMNTLEYQN